MNNYTVYMHVSPSGKRYIGITCQKPKKRWSGGLGSSYIKNEYFCNAIKKYGWDAFKHQILFENFTKEQAEQKEIELIAHYQSNNRLYGYNIDSGGNHQGKMSDETKKKISELQRGEKSVWYGRRHTEETKEKLRIASTGRIKSEETRRKISEVLRRTDRSGINSASYGKPCSAETKLKLSNANKGKHASLETRKILSEMRTGTKHYNAKPIYQYDLQGNLLKRWDYMSQLTKEFGYATANLSKVCKGERKTAYGYKWAYAEGIEG